MKSTIIQLIKYFILTPITFIVILFVFVQSDTTLHIIYLIILIFFYLSVIFSYYTKEKFKRYPFAIIGVILPLTTLLFTRTLLPYMTNNYSLDLYMALFILFLTYLDYGFSYYFTREFSDYPRIVMYGIIILIIVLLNSELISILSNDNTEGNFSLDGINNALNAFWIIIVIDTFLSLSIKNYMKYLTSKREIVLSSKDKISRGRRIRKCNIEKGEKL